METSLVVRSVLVLLCAIIGGYYFNTWSQFAGYQEIPVKPWSSENLQQAIAQRKPVLFKNVSIVANWPASRKWDFEYLQKYIPILPNSYRGNHSFFVYYNYKTTADYINKSTTEMGIPMRNIFEFGPIRSSEFFEICNNWRDPRYVYFSGKLSYIAKEADNFNPILNDLNLNELTIQDPLVSEKAEEDALLWLGKGGIIADSHVDGEHNLYVQLKGKKRFTISPPEEHIRCKLFPSMHPHGRHCQKEQDVPRSSSYKLELAAGSNDVLYIPPYWLHRVETIQSGISLAFWSKCAEEQFAKKIDRLPVPIEADWSRDKKLAGIQLFFETTFGRDFLSKVLNSRYYTIKDSITPLEFDRKQTFTKEEVQKIKSRSDIVKDLFAKIPGHNGSSGFTGTRGLKAFDYIEYVLDFMQEYLGDHNLSFTPRFLKASKTDLSLQIR
jgi:hypothetical protein